MKKQLEQEFQSRLAQKVHHARALVYLALERMLIAEL